MKLPPSANYLPKITLAAYRLPSTATSTTYTAPDRASGRSIHVYHASIFGNHFCANLSIGNNNALNQAFNVMGTLDVKGDITVRNAVGWYPLQEAKVNLGDPNHYIKSIHNEGVRIGTFHPDGSMDAITIKQVSGLVGIGTTNPTQRLEVYGNIKASGGLIVSGSTEPSNRVPGMLWYDADHLQLKIRNHGNTDWRTVYQNTWS